MTFYSPPIRDLQFVLHELLDLSRSGLPGHDELDPEFTAAVLEAAGKLSVDVLLPLNAVGDREGCRLQDGQVVTPTGFKQAYKLMRDGGWTALDCDPQDGGQGLPYVMNLSANEMFIATNMAFNMYQGLTHGAYSAIRSHGTDQQKAMYLSKLASGEWTGTMNLTEPQAGTDLGLLRSKAEPQEDGSYLITGQKIFISAGDHDLTENVIHLVLAKAPGGGEGTRGISLFIVPKRLIGADGQLAAQNNLSVGHLEEKMGIHGNATCVMDYDGATGWLLGDLHKGMRAMFTMMNEARVGVGLQGYAIASGAYQNALSYAKERLQGRAATGAKNPDGPADPLIVHPDIRRNLMDQKSFIEGARALVIWAGHLIDRHSRLGDAKADALVSLLTPIIKGFLTDKGLEGAIQAQQIFGGHGYIEEQGMSQFLRDARITPIYEGANGVQALDLVGRKLSADGGQPVMGFFAMISDFISEHSANEGIDADFLRPLKSASDDMQAAVTFFMQNGLKNPDEALSGSYDFMHLSGHTVLGLMWARMAVSAQAALDRGTSEPAFYEAKLATGRYYMQRQLPATRTHLARILSGASPVMALSAEQF